MPVAISASVMLLGNSVATAPGGAPSAQHDRRSTVRQVACRRFAETTARAGDHDDLAGDVGVASVHDSPVLQGASGISLPYVSRVMLSGSGPRRTLVSSASIAATSSFESSKSKTSKFSAIRAG